MAFPSLFIVSILAAIAAHLPCTRGYSAPINAQLPLCEPGRSIGGDSQDPSLSTTPPISPLNFSDPSLPIPACLVNLTAHEPRSFTFVHPNRGGLTFPLVAFPTPVQERIERDESGAFFSADMDVHGSARGNVALDTLDATRFDAKEIRTRPVFMGNALWNGTTAAGDVRLSTVNETAVFLGSDFRYYYGPPSEEFDVHLLPVTPIWRECGSEFVANQTIHVTLTSKRNTTVMLSLGVTHQGLGCYDSCLPPFSSRRKCGNGTGVFFGLLAILVVAATSSFVAAQKCVAPLGRNFDTLAKKNLVAFAIFAAVCPFFPLVSGFLDIYHRDTGHDGSLSPVLSTDPAFHATTSTFAFLASASQIASVVIILAQRGRGDGGTAKRVEEEDDDDGGRGRVDGAGKGLLPMRQMPGAPLVVHILVSGAGVGFAYFSREYSSWWYTSDAAQVMSFFLPSLYFMCTVAMIIAAYPATKEVRVGPEAMEGNKSKL